MHVFYTPDIQKSNELPEEEAQHCIRVLRLSIGDEITLTDGKGNFYKAEITVATNKRCFVNIKETIFQEPLWPCHLHIAMAPTKNMDRNEWFAEKATEIGFDELTFLNCRFSERKVIKTERIEKILVSAIKQSLKARLPKLNEMIEFDQFIRQEFKGQKFIAHCYEGEKPLLKNVLKPGEDALVLIGPEGDFSEEEVKKAIERGFVPISLGKSPIGCSRAAQSQSSLVTYRNCSIGNRFGRMFQQQGSVEHFYGVVGVSCPGQRLHASGHLQCASACQRAGEGSGGGCRRGDGEAASVHGQGAASGEAADGAGFRSGEGQRAVGGD